MDQLFVELHVVIGRVLVSSDISELADPSPSGGGFNPVHLFTEIQEVDHSPPEGWIDLNSTNAQVPRDHKIGEPRKAATEALQSF